MVDKPRWRLGVAIHDLPLTRRTALPPRSNEHETAGMLTLQLHFLCVLILLYSLSSSAKDTYFQSRLLPIASTPY